MTTCFHRKLLVVGLRATSVPLILSIRRNMMLFSFYIGWVKLALERVLASKVFAYGTKVLFEASNNKLGEYLLVLNLLAFLSSTYLLAFHTQHTSNSEHSSSHSSKHQKSCLNYEPHIVASCNKLKTKKGCLVYCKMIHFSRKFLILNCICLSIFFK